MKKFKSGFLIAAICAIALMTSCSKDTLIPGGTLGDPKDPSNGMVSTTLYSPGLGPIPPQRQESVNIHKNMSVNHGAKSPLNKKEAKAN